MRQKELFKLSVRSRLYSDEPKGLADVMGGPHPITSRLDLASVLLQFLYTIYDSGGISAGRSLESVLLESARDLLKTHVGYQYFEWGEDYFKKAAVDASEPKQDWLFPWVGLEDVLDDQLAYLLLLEISVLYRQMEKEEEYSTGLLQNRIVRMVLGLFPKPEIVQPDRAALVQEARERVHRLYTARQLRHDWDEGYNWPK